MEQHGRAMGKARFCFFDTGVRHARAFKPWTTIQGHGTLCHHREARRPRSHPQRDIGDRVLPQYVLQPKFGTHSLSFYKLRRRSYFRYYAHDPSLQHHSLPITQSSSRDEYPEFGVTLGLYTNEFMEEEDMHALPRRRENTGVVNIHDAYYLWCMANAHVTNLAYFIAFAIRHQTKWHRKGVISIGPYVMHLARYFGFLNTVAQSLALTLIGQMSSQGITTMLHMRMIERQRGTDPPQYRLTHAIDEEDLEDIPDDVPP
ncbi:hypothetical protein GOBAR_AA33604 [Gossypium barbadense]|uniref:Uncharacterized protein n=1 Tax=Gossypium barbadense TaxID=3634 RepID=A0A2P5W7K8_GOSBA|nr:hypothetical protein GOBAR_AA33604 [Gossypium barbadense]